MTNLENAIHELGVALALKATGLGELRLARASNNLCDVHRKLPLGARALHVRYTRTSLIVLFKA